MISLKVDNREHAVIESLNKSKTVHSVGKSPHARSLFSDNYSVERLDIGDLHFLENDNVVLILERKTHSDWVSSITDGRYREQKQRLLAYRQTHPECHIGYIFEADKCLFGTYSQLQNKAQLSAKLSSALRDGIVTITTDGIDETVAVIKLLMTRLPEFKIKKDHTEYQASLIKEVKGANLTPKICFQMQLCQIPGLSKQLSMAILENYGSMKDLVLAMTGDRKADLKTLENLKLQTTTGKSRKLGKVCAEKVYTYLGWDGGITNDT